MTESPTLAGSVTLMSHALSSARNQILSHACHFLLQRHLHSSVATPPSSNTGVLGPCLSSPQPHGHQLNICPPAPGPLLSHQRVPSTKASICDQLAWGHLPGNSCWVPAHLHLPRAPRDLVRVHGALHPWPRGAVPCRWVGSAGCLAGGPRTLATDQAQHAMESPGPSPPRSPEMRMRKETGWTRSPGCWSLGRRAVRGHRAPR